MAGAGFKLIRTATAAGIIGLVIIHSDSFGKIVTASVATFRKAVSLA